MQFERIKSELKRSFYELNKINGKTVILRKRILNWGGENTLSGLEDVFGQNRKGLRVKSLKSWGFFAKLTAEGVSFNWGRWTRIGGSD